MDLLDERFDGNERHDLCTPRQSLIQITSLAEFCLVPNLPVAIDETNERLWETDEGTMNDLRSN